MFRAHDFQAMRSRYDIWSKNMNITVVFGKVIKRGPERDGETDAGKDCNA